jgi:aspartate/methionine/tyrosine aminotransferase
VGDIASESFRLENYFAKHEFSTRYLICCSDCESWTVKELLEIAKDDSEIRNAWDNLHLGYTQTRGLPALRQVFAEQLGMQSSDEILMFAGAEEGIFCTFRTLLTKEDHAIVFTPCYQSLLSIPEACAGEVSRFELDAQDNWSVDIHKLEGLIKPGRTKLIVMNFPHNPTGTLLPLDSFHAIVALAIKYDLYLFCDEIYKGIERVPAESVFPTVAHHYPNKGITLGGVSKSHGLPGLRIGLIACTDTTLLEQIGENKHYLSICNSAPSEILAWLAVKHRAQLWHRNREIVVRNLALFESFLQRNADLVSCSLPSGGCCAFMRLNIAEEKVILLEEIAERIVKEKGLLILPGCNFPSTAAKQTEINRHLRMGLGRRNFPEALAILEESLTYFR